MDWVTFVKYFLHGIFFSILFLILGLIWIFAYSLLIVLGFIIGLIIGIGLLFLIVGLINMALGVYLWDIDTGGHGFWGLLIHGAALFVILFIVDVIVSFLPNYVFPGTATLVVTFIIRTFLYGVIGEKACLFFGHRMSVAGST